MESKRSTILIADDNPAPAQAVKRHLAAEFDVIACVGDGGAMLEAAVDVTHCGVDQSVR